MSDSPYSLQLTDDLSLAQRAEEERPRLRRRLAILLSVEFALCLLLPVVLIFAPTSVGNVLGLAALVLPLVMVSQLARHGCDSLSAKVGSWIGLSLVSIGAALFAAALTGVILHFAKEPLWQPVYGALLLTALGGPVLGLLLLLPRRRLGVVPFSTTVATLLTAILSVATITPLLLTGRTLLQKGLVEMIVNKMSSTAIVLETLAELPLMVLAILLAAGWIARRSLRDTAARLGLRDVTGRQLLIAAAATTVLALPFASAEHWLVSTTWAAFGWPQTDLKAFEQLLAPMLTPAGIVVLSLWAGVIEELAIRGLLQPRVGIFASSLLFTSMHALQYHFDALLAIFAISLVLGWLRRRTNVAVTIVVHACYDLALFAATALGWT